MYDPDTFDPKRDIPNERVIPVEGGPPFIVSRRDPYGLFFIHREHGQIPAKLDGMYTTFEHAEMAVKNYIQQKTMEQKAAEARAAEAKAAEAKVAQKTEVKTRAV